MENEKVQYLKTVFIEKVKTLDANAKGIFGLMNAQQMVEHMTYSFRVANGKEHQEAFLTAEQQEKVRHFFLSDKPFRENTKNAMLPENPFPMKNASMEEAVNELKAETDLFFKTFTEDKNHKTTNPLAGVFDFEQWVQLLYKHALHHAKQFGLI